MYVNNTLFIIYCVVVFLNFAIGIRSAKKSENKLVIKKEHIRKVSISLNDMFLFVLISLMLYVAIQAKNLPDDEIYIRYYNFARKGVFEPGYYYLTKLSVLCGLSFKQFRGIIIIISLFLLYKGVRSLGINKNIVFSLYAIYPFTLDVIQLRNFISLALVIYSIQFLRQDSYRAKVKFCIIVLLSASMHVLSLIYLILLLANKHVVEIKWRQRLLEAMFLFFILISFAIKASGSLRQLVYHIFLSFNETKGQAYVTWGINWGFVFYWGSELLFLYIAYKIKDDERYRIYNNYFWINLVLAFAFPLLTVNVNFYRIYRNINILNYGMLENLIKKRKKIFMISLFILAMIMNFYFNIYNDIENAFWIFFA